MRRIAILIVWLLAGTSLRAHATEHRVLFIGNSLTYVNDLPNAFASLATSRDNVRVDMIARPGAQLGDYVNDPIVIKTIKEGRYSDVILQERGGEAFCASACQKAGVPLDAERPALLLTRLVRTAGARVFYLGTWQTSRETNQALEYGERHIAEAIGATYVEIAEPRRGLMDAKPSLAWTHADGQHPGYATTAFMALRVWRTVFGSPAAGVPCVAGPLHYHAPQPDGVLHVDAMMTPRTCLVSRDDMSLLNAFDP